MAKRKSKGMNMKLIVGAGVLVILIVVLFFAFSGKSGKYSQESVDSFAQCLKKARRCTEHFGALIVLK